MSGRPKAGQAPTCDQFGPCIAPRVRRTKGDAGHPVERCRNCAKPLTHKSFKSWVQERSAVPVDQVVSLYKSVYPTANIVCQDKEGRDNAKIWLKEILQLGSVEDTYEKEGLLFDIADFVYCQRHTTAPTKLYLKKMLDARGFEKASNAIKGYETSHGVRLVHARQYYNRRIRAYNTR